MEAAAEEAVSRGRREKASLLLINTGGKGETFVIDTTNILFVLSGAFVGLESMVNRRLGKGVSLYHPPIPARSLTASVDRIRRTSSEARSKHRDRPDS